MRYLLVGALLTATSCAMAAPDGDLPEPGVSGWRCDASNLGDLIGRTATQELGEEALRRSQSRTLRWIQPGDAVTMDYRPDRLNIRLDSRNRVEGFACG